jgi:glycosyltransferase involved in cell wall biosynthesis
MSGGRPAAFYAPLKHPFETEISGERQIGRDLLAGLRAAGFAPELASRLRTWRRTFDSADAARLERRAALTAELLVHRYRRRPPAARPRLWMTYQNYYRCPDLLGPAVATALAIPYVLVDTAVSTRSRRTPFRAWASAARLAARRADLIFAMHPRDLPRLAALRGPGFAARHLVYLPAAVDLAPYATGNGALERQRAALAGQLGAGDGPILLCVAMMRAADKLDSYRLLGEALARVPGPWRLVVAGDGPARSDVEAALAPLPAGRVTLLGAVPPERLPEIYLGADLFAFPGIGDALGLVYLEAGAAGLPIVACQGPGLTAMVTPEGSVLTPPTPAAYADALARLLADPARRAAMGAAARRFVTAERSREAFERALAAGLAVLGPLPPARPAPRAAPKARP